MVTWCWFWLWLWLWLGTAVAWPCTDARPEIVVNEWLANPSSDDAGLEWVEVYNGAGEAVDLTGWTVASGTSSYADSDPFPPGTEVPAGGYLVVGQAAIPEVDVVAPGFVLGNAGSNADAVQLRDCGGGVADTVVYGEPNDDGWLDDAGAIAISLAPPPPDGGTLGRDPDGQDSDRCAIDVIALPWPTPGEPNDAPPETCGGPGSGLKVNELLPDPEGPDEGFEWVELFHAGREPIDLAGWSLESGTSSAVPRFTWSEGSIQPGEHLLVEGITLGNASSNADLVRIVDCLGFPADTVVYGTPNDDGFLADDGQPATSLAPVAGSGEALQRRADGVDTDRSGDDFAVTSSPTPGAANEPLAVPLCEQGDVVLNEILVDPEGSDEGGEWVELHNRSSVERSLAGWSLRFATGAFGEADVVLPELILPAGGFLVVGGDDVDEADVVAVFSAGNGTDTDGIRLVDCAGEGVDTVLYGESPNADLVPDDLGEAVAPYGDPGSDQSLARIVDGEDTDRSTDWKVVGIPTPGGSNVRPVDGADPGARSGGCGPPSGRARAPGDPSGCRTAPGPAVWPWALLSALSLALRASRRPASTGYTAP